jgi:hypothetical protein
MNEKDIVEIKLLLSIILLFVYLTYEVIIRLQFGEIMYLGNLIIGLIVGHFLIKWVRIKLGG